jgi:AAA15 family ATPase/GTPase
MIKSVHIKNFKSVVNLPLELGKFNVFIGENGCGKSNILEAIAFGAAASADKLDYEFLGSRGIRIPNPEFMYSAFVENPSKEIEIDFITDKNKIFDKYEYKLVNDNNNKKKWINVNKEIFGLKSREFIESLIFEGDKEFNQTKSKSITMKITPSPKVVNDFKKSFENLTKLHNKEFDDKDFFRFMYSQFLTDKYSNDSISDFIVFSPEQSSLRKFEETTQIYPLGIKGEGLFQYLKEISLDKKSTKVLDDIKQNLALLDWYQDFELPNKLLKNEYALKIKDKFLHENIQYFDQRSTNEGFLYLLFYSTLFISKLTPSFFAIDNIDTSFNPKLCVQLVKNLATLTKKNNKQVILTTHNPAILDGLNLKDDNQRLFVIRRNDEGHTTAKRILYKSERKLKLSEIWTSGFIGGLPDNF